MNKLPMRAFCNFSIAVSLARAVIKNYWLSEERIKNIYMDSLIHKIAGSVYYDLKKYFQPSFVKKIAAMKQSGKTWIVDGSMLVGYLRTAAKAGDENSVKALANMLKRAFETRPLKNIGLVMVSFVLINMILAVLLGLRMTAAGIGFRCAFLLVGLACLASRANWKDIWAASRTVRLLRYFYADSPKR